MYTYVWCMFGFFVFRVVIEWGCSWRDESATFAESARHRDGLSVLDGVWARWRVGGEIPMFIAGEVIIIGSQNTTSCRRGIKWSHYSYSFLRDEAVLFLTLEIVLGIIYFISNTRFARHSPPNHATLLDSKTGSERMPRFSANSFFDHSFSFHSSLISSFFFFIFFYFVSFLSFYLQPYYIYV